MGKIYRENINDFSGGQSDDIRQKVSNAGALVKHFNIFNSAKKLIPYRSTEADTNDGSTASGMKQYDVRDFQLGSNGKLYGHAKIVATGYTKVVSKADPTTGNWTLEATAEGNAARIPGCFIEWQGAWWMFAGTTAISKWTIGSTFSNAVGTAGVTITTVAQGIVGADNNLYMFYNNRVVRVNPAGSVSDNVLTALPSDMRITSVARYGTYLAIGMAFGTSASASPSGASKVFIWDMVTDTTVSDVIDWGDGSLMVLGNIEGRIVGVSDKYMSSTLGAGSGSMVIRLWSGGIPQVVKEVIATQNVTLGRFLNTSVIKDNKLYWVASVPFGDSSSTESSFKLGIWCYGRKNVNSNFALSLDYIEEGIDTANYKIVSFGNAGNFWFINHSADGSITKTDDTGTYSFTSIYESQKLGDGKTSKKLVGVGMLTEPLPVAATATLKYKSQQDIPTTATSPGTMANTDGGGGATTDPWTDVNNAKVSDTAYANSTMDTTDASDYLDATNFGFAIPNDAIISGVKVEVAKGANFADINDNLVKLIIGGSVAGDDKKDTTTDWPITSSNSSVIDSYSESNRSADVTLGSNVYKGQTFACSATGILDKCTFYLRKGSANTIANITAKIYAHTGTYGVDGVPTGAALATSATISSTSFTTSLSLIDFTFSGSNKILLSSGSKYVVVLFYEFISGISSVLLGYDSSSPSHDGNYVQSADGSTWAYNASYDVCFYVYQTDFIDYITHGASNDLWGNALTPAIINASNFGVRIQALNSNASTNTALINHIKITVYYRNTWATIFSNTTDNSVLREAVNIESSSATLPVFKEIEFRAESTGGAEILGLTYDYEIIPDGKYE